MCVAVVCHRNPATPQLPKCGAQPKVVRSCWCIVVVACCVRVQNVWYYPNEVYVDKELLTKTKYIKAETDFGKVRWRT